MELWVFISPFVLCMLRLHNLKNEGGNLSKRGLSILAYQN